MPNIDLTKFSNQFDQLLKTSEQIQSLKGAPKKQTTEQGDLYYWYGSIVPHKAELYRFENGKVVWTSIDVTADKVSVQDFVEVLGEPEYSVKRYNETSDSLQNKIIAWPSKGRVLIASGNDLYAQVQRTEFFQPETVEQYLKNWGIDYVDKEKVNILVTPTPFIQLTPIVTQAEQPTVFANSQIRVEFLLFFIIVAIALFFAFLSFKRKKTSIPK